MNLFNRNLRSQDLCGSSMNHLLSYFLPSQQVTVSSHSVTRRASTNPRQLGVSLIELMLVVLAIIILLGIAIPSVTGLTRSFRIGGDTRAIAAQLNLARLRAAADFTHARVYADLAGNTFQLQVWSKGGACWIADLDNTNTCLTYSFSAPSGTVVNLSPGDTFGFGSISTGPTAATSSIAQAPACTTGVGGPSPGSTIANTACIEFNSRTYPVNSSNTIVASDAIYIKNAESFSAIAVSVSGQPSDFRYSGSAWAQF